MGVVEDTCEGRLAYGVDDDTGVLLPVGAEGALGEAFVANAGQGGDFGVVPNESIIGEARPWAFAGAGTSRGGAFEGEADVVLEAHGANAGA